MLLSNDDAEGVWCPFGRARLDTQNAAIAVNRHGTKGTNCKANACMAWRWAGWRVGIEGLTTIAPQPADKDRTGPRLGYCGLAGKPYGVV